MRKFFFRFIALFYLFSFILSPIATFAQFAPNAICPVMPGEKIKQKFYVDYQGERVYLCCRNCVIAFKKNPNKFMKRLARLQKQKIEVH